MFEAAEKSSRSYHTHFIVSLELNKHCFLLFLYIVLFVNKEKKKHMIAMQNVTFK